MMNACSRDAEHTAYFFITASGALKYGMSAVNGLEAAASNRVIAHLRERQKLPAFLIQPKQLACVCAWPVTHQHFHLPVCSLLPDSPINKTMTAEVIVAADIRR